MRIIFIEKEPGYNCEHQTDSNSKQSRFWKDMSKNCAKMSFLLFLNFLATYNFNFGKSYSFIFPYKFGKIYNFIFPCEFAKIIFLYKKYIRDYIQLYSQPYLSEVYSEHFFFLYNIIFTKSKIFSLILLKTFLLVCCKFTLNLY